MIFCLFICFMFWLRSFKSDVFSWNSMQERSDWALKEAWELELLGITTTTRQTLALLEAQKVEMHSFTCFTLSTPKRNPTESNPKLQVTRFHFKCITYSQKCVFSRIHTIKKKTVKKKRGGNCGNQTFPTTKTTKTHKTSSSQPNVQRRGPRARPGSHRPNPRPLPRSQRNQRRFQKRRKIPEFGCQNELFLEMFFWFWSFWGFCFFHVFPSLIVFGYGCIWLFSFQLLVVWPCFCAVSTGLRPRRDLLHRLPFGHLRRLAENLQLSSILLDEWEQRWIMVNRRNCSNERYWARLSKETVFVLEVGEKNEMPQMPQMSTKPRLVD